MFAHLTRPIPCVRKRRLFSNCHYPNGAVNSTLDPTQLEFMKEKCILVDEQDRVVGSASKEECHRGQGKLHRAFSVFLFNRKNELLMQQRSKDKILFPFYWANTCCSHPLSCTSELESKNYQGVKSAAGRKLTQELGLPLIPAHKFKFISRILYKAPSNAHWAEHELDYILLLRGDFLLLPNPNEVSNTAYIAKHELRDFVNNANHNISPWFRLIAAELLPTWWDQLDQLVEGNDSLDTTIHNYYSDTTST